VAKSQTSQAWARIGAIHHIEERLANGESISLSAQEIKELGGREPRLMTKFDTRASRPPLLSSATVLPVTNGSYVILPGDGYHDLIELTSTTRWPLVKSVAALRTLPWTTGPCSESQALDMALAAGILGDFLDDPHARLTVRGRRRAPRFDFEFHCPASVEQVVVEGVQVEVDSGLEGDGIHLIEGKLGSRDDFHVRQLYYPLRMWQREVPEKKVSTVFMTWSNRRFELRMFSFEPANRYHAIKLVKAVDYVIEDESEVVSLAQILNSTELEDLPKAPFPQADDIRKVIDIVDAVGSGTQDRTGIADKWNIDERQADYYGNAAIFLGLLLRTPRAFALSSFGSEFVRGGLTERMIFLARRMTSLPVFRTVLEHAVVQSALPDHARVAELIARSTGLTGATPLRRASTVIAWARWMIDAFAEHLQVPIGGQGDHGDG